MKSLTYSQILEKSFHQTKNLFLNPFSFKRWLIFLFIAVMAGQLGGGGGGSIKDLVDLRSFFEKNAEAQIAQDVSAVSQEEHVKQKIYTYWDKIQTSWHNYQHDPQMMLMIALSVVGVFFLIFLMIWLSVRFYFVWLHAVSSGDTAIKKPFKEYRKEGQSLFAFILIFGAVMILVFGFLVAWMILIAWPFLSGHTQEMNIPVVVNMILAGILGVVTFLALALLIFFLNYFVIPIMFIRRLGVMSAWKEFGKLFRANAGEMLLSALIFFGLSILAGLMGMLVVIAVVLVGLLIGGLIGGLLYILFNVLLALQYAGKIILITLAVIWFCVVLIASAAGILPLMVFLRYFMLNFLTSLNSTYDFKLDSKQGV